MPNKLARRAIDTRLTVQPTILLHSTVQHNVTQKDKIEGIRLLKEKGQW